MTCLYLPLQLLCPTLLTHIPLVTLASQIFTERTKLIPVSAPLHLLYPLPGSLFSQIFSGWVPSHSDSSSKPISLERPFLMHTFPASPTYPSTTPTHPNQKETFLQVIVLFFVFLREDLSQYEIISLTYLLVYCQCLYTILA